MGRLAFVFLFGGMLSFSLLCNAAVPIAANSKTVVSPDQNICITVNTGAELSYSVSIGGRRILRPSPISLSLSSGQVLGKPATATGSSNRSVNRILHPVVKVKRAEIRDSFNELRVDFKGNYSLTVRVFDDGMAYRFSTALPGEITIADEQASFRFAEDGLIYFPEEEGLMSHQERLYLRMRISEIKAPRFSSLPALVKLSDGLSIVITESDLLDYAGMDLTADAEPNGLRGLFPRYPAKVRLKGDRDEEVIERADYVAKTRGTREFPWRVLAVAAEDRGLISTDIVYRLASETSMADTGWIKPGKVAWDWWNANNVYNVPFHAGINTDTYKYYIDFAAAHGIEYVILDEGWYKLGDLMSVVPDMDMDALTSYAREKKVGLILWAIWKTLDQQMDAALERFEKWGIKGIKVDFMQREDQWMVNFYERAAREAFKHHLLVDFHGAYKPTGLSRTYPNVLTSEGVRGLEHNKWSVDASPMNAVTFPFIRMLAGPVDYTPGAMINAAGDSFAQIFNRPMSQGTRCQQLAMYVVFESPLQMLADSPSNYLHEPESLEFLSAVPSVWDETRVLDARLGEYILTARRHGEEWYVGAMTNWTPRDLELDFSFLGGGSYQADIYRDGPNADRVGVDYQREKRRVVSTERLRIHLAPGGGWAARIVRK
jgi:alpha-glucosidase